MLDTLIENKIKELPHNIQYAIEHFDWAQEILHLAKEYQLQIDDVEIFRRETLLVIAGLTPAEDFEKNIASHMNIKHELAEKLVADANEHIFTPLRKFAFTHHKKVEAEPEHIPHEEMNDIMSHYGVELIDEGDTREYPKNELQKLADSLFEKEIKREEVSENISPEPETLPEKIPVHYNEEIHEDDLLGIYEHRTPGFNEQNIKKQEDKLGSYLLENTHISKTERFDYSPSKEEQIKENGSFLKHIGAA